MPPDWSALLDFTDLDDQADVYLWKRIAGKLEDAIGKVPPRTQLPSEAWLIGMTGAGRKSVRHALHHLRDDRHLIHTVPNLGNFTSPRPG
jgi:DNA-binding GntR family transcriptional regulator